MVGSKSLNSVILGLAVVLKDSIVSGAITSTFSSNGKYVGVFDDTNKYTWSQADSYCLNNYFSHLGSLHSNADEIDANSIFNGNAWIGLHDIDTEGTWEWIDGTSYDYSINWEPGQPTGYSGQDCVRIQNGADFRDLKCSNKIKKFICNAPALTFSANGDYVGVKVDNAVLWSDANNYCQSHYDTSLASYHSSNEETDVNNIFSNNAWIGLNDIDSENVWEWIDGSNYDYTVNWGSGNPSNSYGNEDCAQLRGDDTINDRNCDTVVNTRFICSYPSGTNTISSNGNYIGVYDSSVSRTWIESNSYCNRIFGTSLASYHSPSQETEVSNVFSNNAWIGLNDIDNENVWTWIDGSNYDHTVNWGSGNPSNSYGNEHCAQLRGDDTINDRDCDVTSNYFVCNANTSRRRTLISRLDQN